MGLTIRWMVNADLPEILDIEFNCFENPWSGKAFHAAKKNRDVVVMVADIEGQVVGYMVYELHKHFINVLNFAVHYEFRRKGVGRAMVAKLLDKLCREKRNKITLKVRDTNLGGQNFYKALGFKAVSVLYGAYSDSDDAAYLFEYNLEEINP